MKKQLLALTLSLFLLLALFSGCGGSANGATADAGAAPQEASGTSRSAMSSSDSAAYDAELGFTAETENAAAPTENTAAASRENTKLILTAHLSAESTAFDESDQAIQKLTAEMGGYMEHNSLEGNAGYRYASYVLRIPQQKYEAFLNQVGALCSVTYRSTNQEDISEQYFDRESRLKAQTTKRDRLLALLEKAEKMEDIIQLESALADVQVEIESLTGELRKYDSLVNYSTVHLDLSEVRDLSAVPDESSFLSDLKLAFHDGNRGLVSFFQGLMIGLVGGWPFFLILILVIVVGVRVWKKRRSRDAEMNQFFTPKQELKPEEDKPENKDDSKPK